MMPRSPDSDRELAEREAGGAAVDGTEEPVRSTPNTSCSRSCMLAGAK